MKPLKYDLEKLKDMHAGFSYYILGRSFNLEENGDMENFESIN